MPPRRGRCHNPDRTWSPCATVLLRPEPRPAEPPAHDNRAASPACRRSCRHADRTSDAAGAAPPAPDPGKLQPRAVIVLGIRHRSPFARPRSRRRGDPDCHGTGKTQTTRWRGAAPPRLCCAGFRLRQRGSPRAAHSRCRLVLPGRLSLGPTRSKSGPPDIAPFKPYLKAMRAEDILRPTPAGLCCPPGDFYIDPVRPVDARGDHPRPCRPCPRRPRRGAGDAGDPRHHGLRYGADFAGATQASAMARSVEHATRSRCHSIAPAMCWARPRWLSLEGHAHRRVRGLQAPPIRPARRSSRCPAMSSSPRRPSACRCSAIRRPATRSPSCCARSRSSPSAAIWSAPMRWARRSGSSRLLREAGYDQPIYLHGALERLNALYEAHGIDLGALRARDRRARRPNFAGADRHRPALGARRPLDAAAFPIRSPPSPRAGCGCAPAPGSAASSCRW